MNTEQEIIIDKPDGNKTFHRETPFLWVGSYEDILKYGGTAFPPINELRALLSKSYRIRLKLSDIRANLYVNGKACLVRKGKFQPIIVYPGVKIIEGTDIGYGGSNSYPHIAFREGFCIVDVDTIGFPHLELKTYRMSIEIIDLKSL